MGEGAARPTSPTQSEGDSDKNKKATSMTTNARSTSPSRRLIFLAAEALGGAAAGLVLAAALGFAGARVFAGSSSGWGDLVAALMGSLIGYTIGVSAGVALVGRRLGQRGSYWPALLGSVLGVALVLLAAEPLRLNASPALLQATFAIVAPILSALMFTMGLRLRK